jgi:hypothetical protein
LRAETHEGVHAALAHTPRPRRGMWPSPEGRGTVLCRVRGDVDVEVEVEAIMKWCGVLMCACWVNVWEEIKEIVRIKE